MKHQSYIRSLFVAFCAFFVCTSAMAKTVHLNPFAYRIGNYKATNMVEKSGDPLLNDNFVINYALSGDAESVIVRFWNASSTWTRANANNGATLLAEMDITNEKDSEGNDCYKKGYHTYTLDFTHIVGLATNQKIENFKTTSLRWTIDVMGGNQSEYKDGNNFINANQVTETLGFRYPGSVDICDNPYDYNFGAVFCTESRVIAAGDDPSYVSYEKNPTIYVFGGGMEFLPARYFNNHNTYYSFNGKFNSVSYFCSYGNPLYARAPHRVRISEDGRVFLSSLEGGDKILFEMTQPTNDFQNNFYEPHEGGSEVQTVFNGGTWDLANLKLTTSGGDFIASPNSGMDVRGTGSNLELLLLSATTEKYQDYTANPTSGTVYPGINQSEWHLSRYLLGANTTWGNKKCSEEILDLIKTNNSLNAINELTKRVVATDETKLGDAMFVGYDHIGLEYDPNGGCWIVQYRERDGVAATIVHYNATTRKVDFEEHVSGRNSGGVRHNYDFTKLAIAGGKKNNKTFTYDGKTYNGEAATEGQITIYSVSYTNGAHTFSNEAYIAANGGGFHDFAWDFADNLYAADSKSHKLVAYALPHKNKEVSTPSMSQFNLTLSPIYNFSVNVLPANYATITHERIGKAPYPHYLHNAKMDLRADVVAGCKFYQWTGQSTGTTSGTDGCKLLINSLTKNEAITANVGLCVYEDTKILGMTSETTFPAAFVKRELDNISYSTICLPFNLTTLEGTPYEGASVLKLEPETPSNVDGNRIFLNFIETTSIEAGKPYLIQLPKGKQLQLEEIFTDVTCPVLSGTNAYGGLDVNCGNDITFHAIMNPSTIKVNENTLFLTADNRLVRLYGQSSVSINGLRGYFTVSGDLAKTAEFVLNLPEKVTTSIPMVNMADSLQVTKYLWDGKIYIQKGNQVYDLSGARVK